MKCSVHQDKDAVGVCVTCGNPLCVDCKIVIQGKMRCKTCVESGTAIPLQFGPGAPFGAYPPPGAPPMMFYPPKPRVKSIAKELSKSDSAFYLAGGSGSIASGILAIVLGIAIFAVFLQMESGELSASHDDVRVAVLEPVWLYLLFIISLILVVLYAIRGMGFIGIYKGYRSSPAVVAYVFSMVGIIVFLFLFSMGMDYKTVEVYRHTQYDSGYFEGSGIIFNLMFWLAPIMLGVSGIVTGAMLIIIRKVAVKPVLFLASGIIMMIGGGFLAASIGILGVGLFLLAIGDILLGSSLIIDARFETQTPKAEIVEEGEEGAI